MKKNSLLFAFIILSVLVSISCKNQNNESNKTISDSAKTEVKTVIPKSDCKEIIKAIAGKYFIPVDVSKESMIFTINENLNLELVNYKGSYEGAYVDGKVQFNDNSKTIINFSLKGKNVILKNKNDVQIEFREATDADVLPGTWYYGLDLYKAGARMIFDKKGNWNRPDDMMGTSHGTYKYKTNKKFTIVHFMNRDDLPTTLTMVNAKSLYLTWNSAFGVIKDKHVRALRGKLQSLNMIFN